MSWTKRQFVERAFEEIGYASYAYDLETEQLQSGLVRLDSMMATWNGLGIKLNYMLPSSQASSSLDDESGVPDYANEAIYTNLAIKIAPIVGKVVNSATIKGAKTAYLELLNKFTAPREMKFPGTLPAGAGNKPWRTDDPFIRNLDDGIINPPDNEVSFNG